MDEYDKKYGIDSSTKAVKDFHRKRIMFAIKDGKLYVGPKGSTETHAVWFEKMGWITHENDRPIEWIPRGFSTGDEIYYYVGYDFRIDEGCERIFLFCLKELRDLLGLSPQTKVFGGMIKGEPGTKWKPRKYYGKIEDLI